MSQTRLSGKALVDEADKLGIAVFVDDDGDTAVWHDGYSPSSLVSEIAMRGKDFVEARKEGMKR